MSGMPREAADLPGADQLFAGDPPTCGMIEYWQGYSPKNAPCACWLYSDVGFVTLGFALVGAAKQTYPQQLSSIITGPLGMTNTSGTPPSTETCAEGSIYHVKTQKRVPCTTSAADLKSTYADMLKFLKANLGIFPEEGGPFTDLSTAMQTAQAVQVKGPIKHCPKPGSSDKPTEFSMGLAWQIFQSGGVTTLAKDGATSLGGFSSYMAIVPAQKLAIVMLTNVYVETPKKDDDAEADTSADVVPSPNAVCKQIIDHIINNPDLT